MGGGFFVKGRLAHWVVMIDYICTHVSNGEIESAIPGSSVNNNRGYADRVNLQTNEIFEIKKEEEIPNGETEVNRYVEKAISNCPVAVGSATPYSLVRAGCFGKRIAFIEVAIHGHFGLDKADALAYQGYQDGFAS